MKKQLIIIILLLISLNLFSLSEIYFIYNGRDYVENIIDKKETPIEPFNALKVIDNSQTHRILLNAMEKSILSSLFYIGDFYEFNNVKVVLDGLNHYRINDNDDKISLSFSLGDYDNIILLSAVKFDKSKDIDIVDKLGSAFTLKLLLKKISGKIEIEKEEKAEPKLTDKAITEEYLKFIDSLKRLKNNEILEYLSRYVKLNFELSTNREIITDWTSPANLYYYKKGDYKSCAFFYYYSLKSAGLPVRAYLINHLERKNKEDIDDMAIVFKDRKQEMVQQIEMQYKNVNAKANLIEFRDDYYNSKLKRPPELFFYKPPDFDKSIFLITVEINDKWIYTTGINWIDANILAPERTCAHYSRNGCYYTYFDNDYDVINNVALNKDEFIWDIFYP